MKNFIEAIHNYGIDSEEAGNKFMEEYLNLVAEESKNINNQPIYTTVEP